MNARAAGGARRATNANLALTSMIDFLIVVVVFLLMTFAPDASAGSKRTVVPAAVNVSELFEAPIVTVDGGMLLLDAVAVGDARGVEETRSAQVIEPLRDALKRKSETWKMLHPGREPSGVVVLQIDQRAPAAVVKSVVLSAARAGYGDVSFMVSPAR